MIFNLSPLIKLKVWRKLCKLICSLTVVISTAYIPFNVYGQDSNKKTAKTENNDKTVITKESNSLNDSTPIKIPKPRIEKPTDWGDWNKTDTHQYGVGIQGKIQKELNKLDKSSLLENANNVSTLKVDIKKMKKKKKKQKSMKQIMAELTAMEAKVKQELNDDSEF
ncbi:MAG: hypothetical protein P8I03_16100 [Thalassotalea sp.]|nr:hypothetical protein [Thalassotalea sp.]